VARPDDTPRDLLFGLLALQVGLIDQDQLVAAFGAWSRSRGKTLAEILAERGSIDEESRRLLAAMAEKQLRVHDGDVEKSLASLAAGPPTLDGLAALGDADLTASITLLGTRAPSRRATAARSADLVAGDGRRFRVLRPHARGGLGAVFIALDGELNREVALKRLLDDHADEPSSRTRFVIEAEITGGLEHPGIVPVYGLGHYDDGRPYYAMRFIRGDSLKDAIAAYHADRALKADPGRRSLALRNLLRRFLDVCNAIDYAHGRGVLHRDLKPGNVIVGRHGETLVVDWGLAKLIGHTEAGTPSDERTLVPSSSGSAETLPGSAVGTPAYMSPEQAAGEIERLGPRSDVYSLGATLYCLLTGQAPYSGSDFGAVLREVRKGSYTSPRKLDPAIDRALEAVCRKAMALDPSARYATPRALADDLEHWAAGEPVTAWSEPWSRRARRGARRHRTLAGTALGVLAATTLALAVGVALVNRERRRAEELFVTAHRLAASLLEVAELRLSERPGQESTRRELFLKAVEQYERFTEERPGDAELQRETGTAHFYLANILRFYNQTDAAERHFAAALDRLDRARALDPSDPRPRDLSAEVWRDRGEFADRLGRNAEASRMLARALQIVRDLRSADGESLDFRRTEASVLLISAEVEARFGRPADAERLARDAVDRYGALKREAVDVRKGTPVYAISSTRRTVPLLYLMSLNVHAVTLRDLGRHAEAIGRHDEAVAAAMALKSGGESLDNTFQYGSTLSQRSRTISETVGRTSEAGTQAAKAVEVFADLQRTNPRSTIYREYAALTHQTLAKVRAAQGRLDQAREAYREAREGLEWLVNAAPQIPRFAWELGLVLDDFAAFERAAGGASALELGTRAVAALRRAAEAAPGNPLYLRDLKRAEAAPPRTGP